MVFHFSMSRAVMAVTVVLLCLTSPSLAQKPKADCFDSNTQLGLDKCADKSARAAQARLDSLLKQIRANNAGDEEFLAALEKSQKAWEQYRDAQMELRFPKKNKQAEYGTVFPMCASIDGESLTEERISELHRWLVGAEEGDVCAGSVPVHSK
jgi:uncharacterized protein YecT (DUF1311 family)